MFRWISRCLPGLNILLFLCLLIFAFTDIGERVPTLACLTSADDAFCKSKQAYERRSNPGPRPLKLSQKIFIFYAIAVHLDTIFFASRLCVALVRVNSRIKTVFGRRAALPPPKLDDPVEDETRSLSYYDSIRTSEDSTLAEGFPEVIHAVILPNYSEDLETLTTTLRVLASHPRAQLQYEIYLAMELKEKACEEKANALIETFECKFRAVKPTFHPAGLPGEAAGKGSNVAWAARQIFNAHKYDNGKNDVLITIIDCELSSGHILNFS